jgi:hypothetical protein
MSATCRLDRSLSGRPIIISKRSIKEFKFEKRATVGKMRRSLQEFQTYSHEGVRLDWQLKMLQKIILGRAHCQRWKSHAVDR